MRKVAPFVLLFLGLALASESCDDLCDSPPPPPAPTATCSICPDPPSPPQVTLFPPPSSSPVAASPAASPVASPVASPAFPPPSSPSSSQGNTGIIVVGAVGAAVALGLAAYVGVQQTQTPRAQIATTAPSNPSRNIELRDVRIARAR